MTHIVHSTRTPRARTLVAGTMTALLAACSLGTLAHAEDARVRDMTYDVTTPYTLAVIRVTSSDDKKWDTIQPGEVSFHATMRIDTIHPGYVERVGVFLGKCTNTGCAGHQRVYYDYPNTRDYNRSNLVTFSVDKLKTAKQGIFGTSYGEVILDKCNAGHTGGQSLTPHSTFIPVDTSFTANTRTDAGKLSPSEVTPDPDNDPFDGGDHTRQNPFLLQIECQATAKSTQRPDDDPHRTKVAVQDIDLFLSTYAIPNGAQRGPSGTQCKPLKVTTRIGTDKAGPVNVKLWRQVNGGAITSEQNQMHAEALGSGKFGDDWNEVEHFTQTTTVQYKAEILGGTFAPSTPWKSITIHCNGDYAAPQTNANPDNGTPPRGKPKEEARVPTIVTPPPRVTPPPPRIACVGGQVSAGACACPGSAAPVKLNSAAFRCVKTAQLPERRREWIDPMPRRPLFQPQHGFAPRPQMQPPMRPFMRLGQR